MTECSGIVSKIYGAWYEILQTTETFDKILSEKVLTARLKGKLRLQNKHGGRHLVFVGDYVKYRYSDCDDETSYIIETLIPRQNALYRSSKNSAHCLGANLDRALLTISLTNPELKTRFIDLFLVSAIAGSIKPILLFTKSDLLTKSQTQQLTKVKDSYEKLGYECHWGNLLDTKSTKLNKLKKTLEKGTTVLCGFSGTGKSTFINIIMKKEIQKTSAISESTHKGKHITTNSTLFLHPNQNAALIDTPGVKQWGIDHLTPRDILLGFPETKELLGTCKFHNCLHSNNSRGCSIDELFAKSKQAFDENHEDAAHNPGLISPERSRSLKKMLQFTTTRQKEIVWEKNPANKRRSRQENNYSRN